MEEKEEKTVTDEITLARAVMLSRLLQSKLSTGCDVDLNGGVVTCNGVDMNEAAKKIVRELQKG